MPWGDPLPRRRRKLLCSCEAHSTYSLLFGVSSFYKDICDCFFCVALHRKSGDMGRWAKKNISPKYNLKQDNLARSLKAKMRREAMTQHDHVSHSNQLIQVAEERNEENFNNESNL